MRDGITVRRERTREPENVGEFLERWRPVLVVISGPAAGSEFLVDRKRTTVGRGPGVDLAFADPELSQQHAAIEFADGGFRVCDLGSTNGTYVNGALVRVCELKNADRVQLGRYVFQFVLEERTHAPRVYVLPDV
ncbi:MAG: FHA domain-containing protein [Myxococcota bacterium]